MMTAREGLTWGEPRVGEVLHDPKGFLEDLIVATGAVPIEVESDVTEAEALPSASDSIVLVKRARQLAASYFDAGEGGVVRRLSKVVQAYTDLAQAESV
jgi:hypothetical protein